MFNIASEEENAAGGEGISENSDDPLKDSLTEWPEGLSKETAR